MAQHYNVNVAALNETISAIKGDPAKARRTQKVQGTWNFSGGAPQFAAEISFGAGKVTLESDQPSFQGGGGSRPSPMHYALFGLAACFTTTFVTLAAMEGVELDEVKTTAEFDMNLSKTFSLADLPIIEGVRVTLEVRSPASRQAIESLAKLAEARCPASYCLMNPIPLTARVVSLEPVNP